MALIQDGMTAAEWVADYDAREARKLERSRATYDGRLKFMPARIALPCNQCRKPIALGDTIVRPGGRRFSSFWYCYWCGLVAHACDRPLTREEWQQQETLRLARLAAR
jgi:hypothetical protein